MIKCPKCGQSYQITDYTLDEEGIITPVPHKCQATNPTRALVDLTPPEWVHTRAFPSSTKSSDKITCPHCHAHIRPTKLTSHLAKCPALLRPTHKPSPPQPQAYRTVSLETPTRPPVEVVACPDCGTQVSNHRLAKHRTRCPKAKRSCPFCSTLVEASGLAKHMQQCAQANSAKPKKHNAPQLMVQCQRCNMQIEARRIYEHILRVHREEANSFTAWQPVEVEVSGGARKSNKTGAAVPKTPNSYASANDHLGTRDDRDASKGWGHHYRDNGRFGSYPVHDGFDEESEP